MTSWAQARFAQVVLPRMQEGYRLARWLTGSATDAEDVLQDAAIKAFRSIETFADDNPRAWFLTIVRNASYSWLRKNRAAALSPVDDIDLVPRASIEPGHALLELARTPEDVLLAKSDAQQLQAAIEALPVHLRETIILREHHGMSYREIADVTAVPIGTVMSRLATARKLLMTWAREDRRHA